jgi:peptidoglycan-associated lipoprotein
MLWSGVHETRLPLLSAGRTAGDDIRPDDQGGAGMKRGPRVFFTVLMIPLAGALLLGCPKKVTKTDSPAQPRVSEMVAATKPGATPGSGGGEGTKQPTGRQTDDPRTAQLLASRGEDIPIKESATIDFVEPSAEHKGIFRPVYFEYDKSNIRPEYQPVLESISKWLAQYPERQLLVEGHCDERGTDEYNLALGERRALSVRRYLVALGVQADRVHTISYGEEKPAVPGSDESAWAKNRRAEFKVSAQ